MDSERQTKGDERGDQQTPGDHCSTEFGQQDGKWNGETEFELALVRYWLKSRLSEVAIARVTALEVVFALNLFVGKLDSTRGGIGQDCGLGCGQRELGCQLQDYVPSDHVHVRW